MVAGAPVLGPDGLIYAILSPDLNPASTWRVAAFDSATFEELAGYGLTTGIKHNELEIVNGMLVMGPDEVRSFDVPLGTPTVGIDNNGAVLVTVSLSGTQRQFHFPEGWFIHPLDSTPIDDGSVVVRAKAPDAPAGVHVLVRLWLDGTTAAGTFPNDSSTNGAVQITSAGLVQLEETSVVRYDLPAG